jgi:hypothetical protein
MNLVLHSIILILIMFDIFVIYIQLFAHVKLIFFLRHESEECRRKKYLNKVNRTNQRKLVCQDQVTERSVYQISDNCGMLTALETCNRCTCPIIQNSTPMTLSVCKTQFEENYPKTK